MPNLNLLSRLKKILGRRKHVAEAGPDSVSDIAAQTKARLENAGTDLRSIQTRLHLQTLHYRKDAPVRRELAAQKRLDYATRLRRPQSEATVVQTGVYHEGELAMVMSNGQMLNPEKSHKNPVLRNLITTTMLTDIAGKDEKAT